LKSTNYEAPHYALFPSLLSPPPSLVQILVMRHKHIPSFLCVYCRPSLSLVSNRASAFFFIVFFYAVNHHTPDADVY